MGSVGEGRHELKILEVHVMGHGTMARGHHTSLDVLWLHAVEKAVSTGAAARLLREDEGEKEGKGGGAES